MRTKLISMLQLTVRQVVALILLAVALPRLPFWPGPPVIYPLQLLPQETYGWLALVIGIALLVTSGKFRLRLIGRLVSVSAFVLWVTLAAATTSVTSMSIDFVMAYAMFGEIVAQRDDCL